MKTGLRNKICVLLLIVSFVGAPVSQTLSTQRAEAQWATIDVANIIQTTWTALSTGAIEYKEYILDGLAWFLVNAIIEKTVNATTDWVNSGFDGSPTYVTNLKEFAETTLDDAAGEFLFANWGPLEFLCDPFKSDIRLALNFQYYSSDHNYRPVCPITDVIDNFDAFVNGDFYEGGWNGWAKMSLNSDNNPYGALFDAGAELQLNINKEKEREVKKTDWGKGFFTMETCDEVEVGPPNCTYDTPGTVIESGLNNSLDMQNRRLTVGDEIDELIGALMGQLVKAVFGTIGGGGLRGYSSDSPDEPRETLPPIEEIDDETEREYQALKRSIASLILEAKAYCDIEYERELPSSVTNYYDELMYGETGFVLHTRSDVIALEVKLAQLTVDLDEYTLNECLP